MEELKITSKGLTDKEADEIKNSLRERGIGWVNGVYHKGTPKEERLFDELECVDMINSILAYSLFTFKPKNLNSEAEQALKNRYLKTYIESLGSNRVLELIKGQISAISSIKQGVYTDSDGLSYNSIIWVR